MVRVLARRRTSPHGGTVPQTRTIALRSIPSFSSRRPRDCSSRYRRLRLSARLDMRWPRWPNRSHTNPDPWRSPPISDPRVVSWPPCRTLPCGMTRIVGFADQRSFRSERNRRPRIRSDCDMASHPPGPVRRMQREILARTKQLIDLFSRSLFRSTPCPDDARNCLRGTAAACERYIFACQIVAISGHS